MIVTKLITCGLLSLSPITKSTSQIALLEHQLSRDSPTYQTCTINNSNSTQDLKLTEFGNINPSLMNEYSEQQLSNENLILSLDSENYSVDKFITELDVTYFNIIFYNEAEDSITLKYTLNGEFDNLEGDFSDESESGLLIEPEETFTYTGPNADILNQVFSNYIQGGNNMANILSAIGTALTTIGQWFVDLFGSMTAIFYDSTSGLTFVGTLLVVGLSCFLIALVINWVRGFVRI